MKIIKQFLFLLLSISLSATVSAENGKITIATEEVETSYLSKHPDIKGLWYGPKEVYKDQSSPYELGRIFRVAAIIKYPDPYCQNIILDEFNGQDERLIDHVRSINLILDNCIKNFHIKKWLSPTSFEFKMNEKFYVIEDLGSKHVTISRR